MTTQRKILLLVLSCCGIFAQPPEEWNKQAEQTLRNALKLETLNRNVAKNVVIILGDGMGFPTITSARILKGQLDGKTGEETVLHMDSLPYVALAKTYNTDQQVADSAGTATAILCGVKTKAGVVGVHDGAVRKDCKSGLRSPVVSVLQLAHEAGKSTGIVTTTRVTHATPACAYAHSAEREWESNNQIPVEQRLHGCTDIALQLLDKDIQVVLGGGRKHFLRIDERDPEDMNSFGARTDERNLIDEWIAKRSQDGNASYVWNQKQFDAVDPSKSDYLLGLFENGHMQYHGNRDKDIAGEPTLAEMVDKAVRILQKNDKGFLLLIEGGRIDHSHHDGIAYHALVDTIAMDDAVKTVLDMTSSTDTLTIVTADHSHVNAIVGYPSRGNPILGVNDKRVGLDGLPYTTLMYVDGPGGTEVQTSFMENGTRPNITNVDTESSSYVQQAVIPLKDESHGGEDIPIYADGPMAHLFHGTHEQHYIAHVIKYAACLGNSTEHCDDRNAIGGASTIYNNYIVIWHVIILTAALNNFTT
ncbi:alkaline phosphatase-like [Saccoglossus kowalevskii]|uniref:Alkaline phosphatase n=1 Tax=Saccoglossus kowalevskii TaxID=10224 RepID=A0ABM0GIW6_SACKO|nr:PREDICTED: alkaline phosphatase, tissue-nonspecific isozyme-like [Saccoglossus kowalevskii]